MSLNHVYISLGANVGQRKDNLKNALDQLSKHPEITVKQVSSFYITEPIDATGDDYINAVSYLVTPLDAFTLLDELQTIENNLGRSRPFKNAPRTIDLDLLLFNQSTINSTRLTVPHPRMHERAFVLVPLAEIAPTIKIPNINQSLQELIKQVNHQKIVITP